MLREPVQKVATSETEKILSHSPRGGCNSKVKIKVVLHDLFIQTSVFLTTQLGIYECLQGLFLVPAIQTLNSLHLDSKGYQLSLGPEIGRIILGSMGPHKPPDYCACGSTELSVALSVTDHSATISTISN